MRVALYVHVTGGDDDAPLADAQEIVCRLAAARNGWTVVRADRDAGDADWLQGRPGLRRALAAIGRGAADALLVDDPARIGEALLPRVRGQLLADGGRLCVVGQPPWPPEGAGDEVHDGAHGAVEAMASFAHWAALRSASIVLIDTVLADLGRMGDPDWRVEGSLIADYLPRHLLGHYTPVFLKRFFVCVVVASWRLAQPDPEPVACLAEALAVRALVETARALLEMEGRTLDFDIVESEVLEDVDFEYLFDPAQDGVEDSFYGRFVGMEPLGVRHWFVPYGEGTRGDVHPYAADDEE